MRTYTNFAQSLRPDKIREAMSDQNGALQILNEAYEEGMTLSAYLEVLDPSDEWKDEPELDAFGRQMKAAGLVTQADHVNGIWASPVSELLEPENRLIGQELTLRMVRKAQRGGRRQTFGNAYISNDDALGSLFRPYVDKSGISQPRLTAQVTLDMLVSVTTPIDNDTYRAAFLEEPDINTLHDYRVEELGEFPTVKITQGQHAIKIHKHGIAYKMSYEAMRRARLDKLAFWIERSVFQREQDKVAWALEVITNGDGNANGATVDALTVLDPTTSVGVLTLDAWLTWKENFGDAYGLKLAIMRPSTKIKLLTMDIGTTNTLYAETMDLGSVRERNGHVADDVDIASYTSAPANSIIGLDTSVGLEHVIEVGSDIEESVNYITNQSQVIVMSEVEGFAVLDKRGARILNLNA